MTNLERYKSDLAKLIATAEILLASLGEKESKNAGMRGARFMTEYQKWYSEALALIRQLMPARLAEFAALYERDPRRKGIRAENYSIQDWILGVRTVPDIRGQKPFDEFDATGLRFHAQCGIVEAVQARFESSLFDIHQLVQADFFDSELDVARELVRAGFLRAAGVVTGVVLEKHLQEVSNNHLLKVHKKNPTIGDLNDALKGANVVDIPVWRSVQRLADLRNLCGHNKEREPTKDEVVELIEGCAKVTKTLY